jgi:hypothetical protein
MARKPIEKTASELQNMNLLAPTPQHRNFVIPGCSVVVADNKEEGMPIEDFVGIVFAIAGANPGAKVHFHIEMLP